MGAGAPVQPLAHGPGGVEAGRGAGRAVGWLNRAMGHLATPSSHVAANKPYMLRADTRGRWNPTRGTQAVQRHCGEWDRWTPSAGAENQTIRPYTATARPFTSRRKRSPPP